MNVFGYFGPPADKFPPCPVFLLLPTILTHPSHLNLNVLHLVFLHTHRVLGGTKHSIIPDRVWPCGKPAFATIGP